MIIDGLTVSLGYAFGKVYVLKEKKININYNRISNNKINLEINCFLDAFNKTLKQLKNIKSNILNDDKNKKLLIDSYITLLDDESLKNDIISLIKKKKILSEAAIDFYFKKQIKSIEKIQDSYLKERALDILDISKRLIYNVKNIKLIDFNFYEINGSIIIVARDLSPSQIIQFNLNKVVGFVIELGSITSHTTIIAKSLGLPGIINVKNILKFVKDNDYLIIDGNLNKVFINPNYSYIKKLKIKNKEFLSEKKELLKFKKLPAITLDGVELKLFANINSIKDVDNISKDNIKGIGLYRTEFLFMDRDSFPTEEEQFICYKNIVLLMKKLPVTIRIVDLGGDKFLSYMKFPKENMSFLGWRAIRILKDRKDILYPQLRAILRASYYGNIKIMFPMVISLEEVLFFKNEIEKVKLELMQENKNFNSNVKVGIMMETPSAAIIADILAKEVDFFSIGTNDLTQYTLAVDRNNSFVSYLYNPLSISVIRLIKFIIDSAHKENKCVSMCGELASNIKAIILLLGLGIDELSMDCISIPRVKKIIRNCSKLYAKNIAEKILSSVSNRDILDILNNINV